MIRDRNYSVGQAADEQHVSRPTLNGWIKKVVDYVGGLV